MRIDEIKVSAGRTFNHPYEQYSNLRCDVHLNAKLDDGEDAIEATKQLQARAEEICEGHKVTLIKNLHDLERLARQTEEISQLERRIQEAQSKLKDLKVSVGGNHLIASTSNQPVEDMFGGDPEQEDDDVAF